MNSPENSDKYLHTATFLLLGTLILWWSGIAGAALYAIPALGLVGYLIFLISKGIYPEIIERAAQRLFSWSLSPKWRKQIFTLFYIQAFLWLLFVILKYYSFSLYSLDSGYHSNILYNISRGEFFSSVFNIHSLGEHFTPSMSFIALFYKIIPSINWMMGFKTLAYVVSPFLIFLICRHEIKDHEKVYVYSVLLTLWWLFLYRPIVNAMRYEFQASCLAPPVILYAFLSLQKKHWFRFFISMVLILGFKEHLGSVWIGFGCYLVLKNYKRPLGYLLIIFGILAIYLIMFQIKPYFRGTEAGYNDISLIAPFKDLGPKSFYFFVYLLLPLFFIPLIFWKNGIMAGPAIGVNLISGMATMYSSHYHYDDVPATLLFISVAVSLNRIDPIAVFNRIKGHKGLQLLSVIWLMLFLTYLPYSNLRFIKKVIPETTHFEIRKEIRRLDETTKDSNLAVQDVLGPHFYRKKIQTFHQGDHCAKSNFFLGGKLPKKLPEYDYLVLAPEVSYYGLTDYKRCLTDMENAANFRQVSGYQHLKVYKRVESR